MDRHPQPIRRWLARELDPRLRRQPGLSRTNLLVCLVIAISVITTVMSTETTLYSGHERLFLILDVLITAVFALEYALRLWVCVENPIYRNRLRFALGPAALIDLATVLLMLFSPLGSEGFLLRLARVLMILRLAKLGRFSLAINAITLAVSRRAYELWLSLAFSATLLLISSAILYLVEGGVQPEAFGSIPRAMWWSVATLTTVGYGDVYPLTPMGRLFAAVTAITGIGLIAMPTGILASAFSDAFQEQCGKSSPGDDEEK